MQKESLLFLSIVIAVATCFANVNATQGRSPYKKEWDAKYLKQVPAAETAMCNVCHVGAKKKDRNAYGQALAKFLMKGDEKNVAKIQQALADVEKMPSKADDPKSPTFGDLMKQGKLPGGDGK